MRVDAIISITAHQQHKPHTTEHTGISSGKTASGLTFKDYLNANMEKNSVYAVTRNMENQLSGLLMGYFTPLRMTHKDEPKKESNVS